MGQKQVFSAFYFIKKGNWQWNKWLSVATMGLDKDLEEKFKKVITLHIER